MLEEVEHFFKCPYCFERISMLLDCSSEKQEYIEDCEVCCQGININFKIENGRIHFFSASQWPSPNSDTTPYVTPEANARGRSIVNPGCTTHPHRPTPLSQMRFRSFEWWISNSPRTGGFKDLREFLHAFSSRRYHHNSPLLCNLGRLQIISW